MSVIDIEKFREKVASKYISEVNEKLKQEENKPKLRKELKEYKGKIARLSAKELELIKLMLLKNVEIAERMGTLPPVIHYQIKRIREKFDDARLDTNEKLVVMAIRQGLVDVSEIIYE